MIWLCQETIILMDMSGVYRWVFNRYKDIVYLINPFVEIFFSFFFLPQTERDLGDNYKLAVIDS